MRGVPLALPGAREEQHLRDLERLLARAVMLRTAPVHYDHAASLHRRCRRDGETVRKLIDCLIAAVAISAEAAVLHSDRDFEVIARHTGLLVEMPGNG